MAIIKLEPNKPLTVSLKYTSAKERKGQYGIQFLYTLENGDALFLPPIAHEEIQKLHAGPGEPFTLTRTIGQGNQTLWKVERIQPSEPPSEQARPVVAIGAITQKSSTNGKATVAVMPSTAPTLSTPQSRTLVKQLFASVDAWKLTKDYARTQGIEFEPTSRDICALAITGGIQVFKEGGVLMCLGSKERATPEAEVRGEFQDAEPGPLAREVADALNRHSRENISNTPDFILARFALHWGII